MSRGYIKGRGGVLDPHPVERIFVQIDSELVDRLDRFLHGQPEVYLNRIDGMILTALNTSIQRGDKGVNIQRKRDRIIGLPPVVLPSKD